MAGGVLCPTCAADTIPHLGCLVSVNKESWVLHFQGQNVNWMMYERAYRIRCIKICTYFKIVIMILMQMIITAIISN